jgi:transcriptional regulator with XRE-family HTH domain
MSETVRQALRATREAAGVSIAKLARQATFSESHLRSMENGNRKITREAVEGYDAALGTGGILVDLFVADKDGDDMRRRTALGMLGTVSGLGLAAPQVIAESLRESLLQLSEVMIGKRLPQNTASASCPIPRIFLRIT